MTAPRNRCREAVIGRYAPLLGTNVEIRVEATGGSQHEARRRAETAEAAAVDDMVRLQQVFTVFRPDSDLCRWRAGHVDAVPAELLDCLAAAESWWRLSGGAFHPAAAELRALWLAAERDQREPDQARLDELVARLTCLPFTVADGVAHRLDDCSGVDLNAIAKGFIVDAAVRAAIDAPGVADVLVNAGGDLRHLGDRAKRVAVEDPDRPGADPACVLTLEDGAVATSGSVHRGFRIAGRWHSHVLDPRTGHPVSGRPSATARAGDASSADAVATVVNVLGWPEADSFLTALPAVGAFTIDATGQRRAGGNWPD